MWYYEILGKNQEVLEQSEALYASEFEAQYAAYQRIKDQDKPSLWGPLPTTGWKDDGGLRSVATIGPIIRAKLT
jgi:hypothetical protein